MSTNNTGVVVRLHVAANGTRRQALARKSPPRAGANRIGDMIDEAVYAQLLRRAQSLLNREPNAHRLEPADLVHDAFLRIARSGAASPFQNAPHLTAVAVIVMRHVLVDRVRTGKGKTHDRCVPLDPETPTLAAVDDDLVSVAVHNALLRLDAEDQRLAQVVQMRFFLGLTLEEIAAARGISSRTVKRDWKDAREWLLRELTAPRPRPSANPDLLRPAA